MSLPDAWVNALFDRLAVTYGAAFSRMWEGVDIAAVKAHWAAELSHYQQRPHAIKHALTLLPPNKPPTVLQFRDLCRGAPEQFQPRLPAPPAKPEAVAKAMQALAKPADTDPKAWAHRLKERELSGETLSPYLRASWREAIG
jgi:hypothetical protein